MTDKEIINKALEKAITNGFLYQNDTKNRWKKDNSGDYWYEWDSEDEYGQKITLSNPYCPNFFELICNHEFCKSFFGDKSHTIIGEYEFERCRDCGTTEFNRTDYCWEVRLQNMVVEEDPIKYLEKFL